MKEGRKPEYPEKTPDDKLQKMLHTKAQKFKPQQRLKPTLYIGGRLGKQMCLTLHHTIAPNIVLYSKYTSFSLCFSCSFSFLFFPFPSFIMLFLLLPPYAANSLWGGDNMEAVFMVCVCIRLLSDVLLCTLQM